MLRIVDELARAGALKDWCEKARKRLHEGKLYLKTAYCDHCRAFALSDVSDTDYKDTCGHSHDMACGNCESLKSVMEEVKDAIPEYTTQLGKDQANDLQYEATGAASKILEWKAHVLRAQNQDQVKRQILNSLEEDEVHGHEVSREAGRVVCKERNQLACEQRYHKPRRKP